MQHLATVIAAITALAVPVAAAADGLTFSNSKATTRTALLQQQLTILDTRAATQYSTSAAALAPSIGSGAVHIPGYSGRYRGLYLETAKSAAARHGVPSDLFLRLVQQESGWNPSAVSPKGARGLAQLMPATATHLGVDIGDPTDNLDGGARYLRMMYDRFGNWRLALAAYNAGPEAVEKYGDVPPYAETQNYVRRILGS